MKTTETADIKKFLYRLGTDAGQTLMKYFGQDIRIENKPDASLVTEADLASEKLIVGELRQYFPDDLIMSEEGNTELRMENRRPGQHVWIVDPLDGTTNFANRYPYFCVSIGRGQIQENGSIDMRAGAVVDPIHKKVYYAAKGKGAEVNGQPLRVRASRPLKDAFLVTGFYYSTGQALITEVARFQKVAAICTSIRRDGAAALDMALSAEGVFDAFWELGLKPWDVAAGALLVKEAGGLVLNYDQTPQDNYNIEGSGVISGSRSMVEQLLREFE